MTTVVAMTVVVAMVAVVVNALVQGDEVTVVDLARATAGIALGREEGTAVTTVATAHPNAGDLLHGAAPLLANPAQSVNVQSPSLALARRTSLTPHHAPWLRKALAGVRRGGPVLGHELEAGCLLLNPLNPSLISRFKCRDTISSIGFHRGYVYEYLIYQANYVDMLTTCNRCRKRIRR